MGTQPSPVRCGASFPPKWAQQPFGLLCHFWAHVYCGQMTGCIRIPLGTEVNHGSGDIVLDGDPAFPPERGTVPPIFGPCLLWPNGWMDQDATLYGSRPRPRPHCVRWVPSPLERGTAAPSLFGPCLCGQGRPS